MNRHRIEVFAGQALCGIMSHATQAADPAAVAAWCFSVATALDKACDAHEKAEGRDSSPPPALDPEERAPIDSQIPPDEDAALEAATRPGA